MSVQLLRRWVNRLASLSPYGRRPAKPSKSRTFRPGIDFLEDRCLPSTIFWSGNGGDGLWRRADNWVGGVVPAAADDAVIDDSSPPVTVEVTAGSGITVHSLTSTKDFVVDAGVSFTVTAGGSAVSGALTVRPNATLTASGATASFTATGPTAIDAAQLFAQNGAVMNLPGATGYNALGAGFSPTLRADGGGAQLNLPNLTSWRGGGGPFDGNRVVVQAFHGGVVDLSQVAAITAGNTYFQALDGGQIHLSALTRFTGAVFGGASGLEVRRGGAAILAPSLTSLSRVDLSVGGAGQLALDNLGSFQHGDIFVSVDVTAGQLTLPVAVIDESGFNSSPTFRADGAGSRLDLSAVSAWRGAAGPNNGNHISVQALNGGVVDLSGLAQIDAGNTSFQASGNGSQIALDALTTFNASDRDSSSLTADGGGTLRTAQLANLNHVTLSLTGTGTIDTSALVNAINGAITATDHAAPSFPSLTDIDGSSLHVRRGAQLEIPATVTSYNPALDATSLPPGYDNVIDGDGSGDTATLLVVDVTNIIASGGSGLGLLVSAANGSCILFPCLQTIDADVTFAAQGASSCIQMPLLTTFAGRSGHSMVSATTGGAVIVNANPDNPGLTAFSGVAVNASPAGTLTVGTLELDTGSSIGGAGTLAGNLLLDGGDVNLSNGDLLVAGDYTQLDGSVTVRTGSRLTVAGGFTQSGGTTTLLGGTLAAGGLVDLEGGSLGGSGTIDASLRNSAQVDVGGVNSSGRLTVTGDYTQTAAGVLNIEIGGAAPGMGYDQLVVNGAGTLDGTLNVSRIRGYTPASGTQFQILTFGSSDGSAFAMANIDIHFLPPAYDPSDVTLQAA
jgi:hypothetical protein